MKGSYTTILFLLFLPFLLGMSSILGDGPADKIPVPEKNFTAIYVDQMDVTTECTEVSIQGNTFLEGKRGEGTYAIPFENIANILFILKDTGLTCHVRLSDGNTIEMILNKDYKAYGKAQYGTFQIRLNDLKKIIFATQK